MSDIGILQILIPDWISEQGKAELIDAISKARLEHKYFSYKPSESTEKEPLLISDLEKLRCECITDSVHLVLRLYVPFGSLPEGDPRRDTICKLLKQTTFELCDIITMDDEDESGSKSQ